MSDEIQFINCPNEGIWIKKPCHSNQAKGIEIISDIKKFKEDFIDLKTFHLGEYAMYAFNKNEQIKADINEIIFQKKMKN